MLRFVTPFEFSNVLILTLLCFLAVAEKNEVVQRATTLEEKPKALKEENAALKLAADEEKSQKDRLLTVVHTLTGMFKIDLCLLSFCVGKLCFC